MPIYEYRCERGHTFEVLQRMSDDPVTVCTSCDAKVQRVLHPVAVHFKGSGFYTTDYARSGKPTGGDSGSGESSDAGQNGAGKSGSTSTKADKPESPAGTSTGSKASSSD
jgi:putative FmdB family regulatory protein